MKAVIGIILLALGAYVFITNYQKISDFGLITLGGGSYNTIKDEDRLDEIARLSKIMGDEEFALGIEKQKKEKKQAQAMLGIGIVIFVSGLICSILYFTSKYNTKEGEALMSRLNKLNNK